MEVDFNDDGEPVDENGDVIKDCFTCDYKAHPDSVVDSINDLLESHGLELVSHDTGSDFYLYQLRPKNSS